MAWAADADLLLLLARRGSGRDELSVTMVYDPVAESSVEASKFVVAWGASSRELIAQFEDDSVGVLRLSDFEPFR